MTASSELPHEELVALFEKGFTAMWQRAHRTLGDVTLTAISERVLYSAVEKFPAFVALTADRVGIVFVELRTNATSLDRDQLAEGIRFVLVEFLSVLGNLTDQILTPALHDELSNVSAASKDDAGANS